jgi:dolichol-phosphate mannosyltransferase
MILSIIIPAYNEEECIEDTVHKLIKVLKRESINSEILIVNDNSTDSTETIAKNLSHRFSDVKCINNTYPHGFGFCVRMGLEKFSGDSVAIVMADSSDDPEDVVKFFRKLEEGNDCVFGSRFIKGGTVHKYPLFKLILNRMINMFIRILFGLKYNDITNAFKLYHRKTIEGIKPFLSHHFNMTVELPLKAITRGYSYTVIPNSWTNRKTGESKLKLKEMGSRYLFIILYCLIEKWLSVGDYKKHER